MNNIPLFPVIVNSIAIFLSRALQCHHYSDLREKSFPISEKPVEIWLWPGRDQRAHRGRSVRRAPGGSVPGTHQPRGALLW